MGDSEELSKSIKRTQEQLGRFVKKPPLTDKNLSRPPFRFLHDIVKNVIDTTGFMDGVYTPEELDAAQVTSREAKTAFMQKLIGAIKDKTGEEVPIKISKVLAGLEADKTNGLLQGLAKSIEAHQQDGGGGGAPAAALAKKPTKKSPTSKTTASKTGATSTPANAKKAGSTKPERRDSTGGAAGTKRTIRDASPASKPATKKSSGEQPSKSKSGSGGKSKAPAVAPTKVEAAPMPEAVSIPESVINDETAIVEEPEPVKSQPPKLTQRESSANMKPKNENESAASAEDVELDALEGTTPPSTTVAGHVEDVVNANNNNFNSSINDNGKNKGDDDEHELYDNFTASLVKPNMQTLPPPKTPIMTDADAVTATMELSPPPPQLTPSPTSSLGRGGSARPPTGTASRSLSREGSTEQRSPAAIGEIRPPTGQQIRSRPDTGTTGQGRLPSARPPSAARRAPPRPKSSIVREEVEPYRPTTGKVAHVILDDNEDPDDDNYVVREVTITASKPPGLSDLDETPELNLGGGQGGLLQGFDGNGGGAFDDILSGDQSGLLVHQILETKKELEDKNKNEETPMIEKKLRELSLAEIEKLKNLIQVCARSANPLAKLLDYMAEDVDSMQKEYNNYREESKRLSMELENAKGETEKYLQNLKHELTEIERKTKDKEDAILASQMKIIQQEERIEEIVSGFERVRSGKSAGAAKDHMPDATEILAHIQGQSSLSGVGGGGSNFGMGGPSTPSVFTFSAGANSSRLGSSTPSSATSASIGGLGSGGGGQESFKIPDNFMVGSGGTPGNISSPFNRGRMWSSTANNNSATFDLSRNSIDEDMDDQPIPSMTRRSMQRSGGSALMTDVDSFNPWNK